MEKIEKFLETTYGGMIIMALAVLVIGWICINILTAIAKRILNRSRLDSALHTFILITIRILLWALLIIIILGVLNVPTVPLVTILGATGAAIALALKDSLSNVAAGLIILFSKPILSGEIVEINGQGTVGVIDEIDLMTTHMHSFDNKKITVPNSLIINSVVLNYSRERKRRVDCIAAISYKDDINKAKELLLNIANTCPDVLPKEDIIIGVNKLGEDGVLLDLKVWCMTERYFEVKYFVEENIKMAFDEAGIEIPHRKLDVNIRKDK